MNLKPQAVEAPPAVREPGELRFLLRQVGWRLYDELLTALGGRSSVRITYDRGDLELMSPLYPHEAYAGMYGYLVLALTKELGLSVKGGGSTTFRSKALGKGIEPDRCFWIARAKHMIGRRTHDIETDPPPDLAIEVEYTSSALDRMGIYAALRVPEVWRFDSEALFIHALQPDGTYEVLDHSPTFPRLPVAEVPAVVAAHMEADDNDALDAFRAWVRQHVVAAPPA